MPSVEQENFFQIEKTVNMKGMGDAGFTSVTHHTLACGSFLSVSRADSLKANHGNLRLLPCEDEDNNDKSK